MRYLIRIVNAKEYNRHQVREVATDFQLIASKYEVSLKNFRISRLAVEFDLFSKNLLVRDAVIGSLSSRFGKILSVRDLHEDLNLVSKQRVVSEFVKLFNEQRYWECHEIMESIWRTETNSIERRVQQGVIIAASSLVHAQRDEDLVCFNMMRRALDKLSLWLDDKYYDLNVYHLKLSLMHALESREIAFPSI